MRIHKRRSIKTLQDTLRKLCNAIWDGGSKEHMWSIPVDKDRDFDIIINDAIQELKMYREKYGEIL